MGGSQCGKEGRQGGGGCSEVTRSPWWLWLVSVEVERLSIGGG